MLAYRTGMTFWLAVAVVVCSCVHTPPPKMQTYALGSWRASFRNYAGSRVSLCDAEPRWLFDELASVNDLLGGLLDALPAGSEASWSEAQLKLSGEARQTLGPVLDAHEHNLRATASCGFGRTRSFPEIVRRGEEYVRRARQHLAEASQMIANIRASEAMVKWKAERIREELKARRACGGRARRGAEPEVYFAYQDEQGESGWLFCDGAKVVARQGGTPRLEESPEGLTASQRKRLRPARYLEAAAQYPASMVSRAPVPAAPLEATTDRRPEQPPPN